MASAGLRKELECSVCLSVYTDPVNLKCGHNFCRVCIDRVLDTQEGAGGYSCPECREEFRERPTLHRNIKLCNVVENFLSAHPDVEDFEVFCTYCVDSPVAAVKSCLHCEASLCEKHLKFHSKSPEHVITDPGTSSGNRKCPEHKELLKYYCAQDAACICVSCCLIGEHKGHSMESLDEASEKKKKKLRDVLQKMTSKREKTEEQVKNLQKQRRKTQYKGSVETETITALFKDLRRQLEDLEKKALSKISRQVEQGSLWLSDLIQQLEVKKEELSRKIRRMEELCNVTDPLKVLLEEDVGDLSDTEERDNVERPRQDKPLQEVLDLDITGISSCLHALSDIMTKVDIGIFVEKSADLLLDEETANNNLCLSDDRKSATWSNTSQNRSDTPQRFQEYAQALSSRDFSSGRHYWDLDLRGSCNWRVGVCYPSMGRKGKPQSRVGNNDKSWGLYRCHNRCGLVHDSKEIQVPANLSSFGVRIYLDYEGGQLSFYELGTPGRHLHTFTTTFTEPLHAVLGVWGGCVTISGGD